VLPGYNVRPLELEGCLGVEQVKRLPKLVEERRNNGKLLQAALGNHPDITIQQRDRREQLVRLQSGDTSRQ